MRTIAVLFSLLASVGIANADTLPLVITSGHLIPVEFASQRGTPPINLAGEGFTMGPEPGSIQPPPAPPSDPYVPVPRPDWSTVHINNITPIVTSFRGFTDLNTYFTSDFYTGNVQLYSPTVSATISVTPIVSTTIQQPFSVAEGAYVWPYFTSASLPITGQGIVTATFAPIITCVDNVRLSQTICTTTSSQTFLSYEFFPATQQSTVPEPSSATLLAIGGVVWLVSLHRTGKRHISRH